MEVRERLDLQARRPSDVAFGDLVGSVGPGGTVFLRIRLAGDDVAGKTITLTHDENGSVASTTTTDTNGEAFLTYGAPATAQIELVTATITEAGLESGDAVVITTIAPPAAGVTRLRNRAAVAAGCLGGPALDNLVSAPGVFDVRREPGVRRSGGREQPCLEFLPRDFGGREGDRGRAARSGGRRAGYAPRRVRDGGGPVRDRVHGRASRDESPSSGRSARATLRERPSCSSCLRYRRRRSPHVRESQLHGRPQPGPPTSSRSRPSPEPRTATDGRQGRSGTTSRCRSRDEAAVTPRGRGARDAGRDRAVRQAGGKPNPLELSSITPAVADRGGLVTFVVVGWRRGRWS